MKNLLIIAAALGCACTSTPEVPQEVIPAVEYEVGFSLDIPCKVHGVDTNVVSGSRLVRFYEITIGDKVQGEVTGEDITQMLETIRFLESIQVSPVDPSAGEPADDTND